MVHLTWSKGLHQLSHPTNLLIPPNSASYPIENLFVEAGQKSAPQNHACSKQKYIRPLTAPNIKAVRQGSEGRLSHARFRIKSYLFRVSLAFRMCMVCKLICCSGQAPFELRMLTMLRLEFRMCETPCSAFVKTLTVHLS